MGQALWVLATHPECPPHWQADGGTLPTQHTCLSCADLPCFLCQEYSHYCSYELLHRQNVNGMTSKRGNDRSYSSCKTSEPKCS